MPDEPQIPFRPIDCRYNTVELRDEVGIAAFELARQIAEHLDAPQGDVLNAVLRIPPEELGSLYSPSGWSFLGSAIALMMGHMGTKFHPPVH